jgi:hypothetical protein
MRNQGHGMCMMQMNAGMVPARGSPNRAEAKVAAQGSASAGRSWPVVPISPAARPWFVWSRRTPGVPATWPGKVWSRSARRRAMWLNPGPEGCPHDPKDALPRQVAAAAAAPPQERLTVGADLMIQPSDEALARPGALLPQLRFRPVASSASSITLTERATATPQVIPEDPNRRYDAHSQWGLNE